MGTHEQANEPALFFKVEKWALSLHGEWEPDEGEKEDDGIGKRKRRRKKKMEEETKEKRRKKTKKIQGVLQRKDVEEEKMEMNSDTYAL